jgi:hypothetical protein
VKKEYMINLKNELNEELIKMHNLPSRKGNKMDYYTIKYNSNGVTGELRGINFSLLCKIIKASLLNKNLSIKILGKQCGV